MVTSKINKRTAEALLYMLEVHHRTWCDVPARARASAERWARRGLVEMTKTHQGLCVRLTSDGRAELKAYKERASRDG